MSKSNWKCPMCGIFITSPTHKCDKYQVRTNKETYLVYGIHPEHAAERLAARIDEEITVTIEGKLYDVNRTYTYAAKERDENVEKRLDNDQTCGEKETEEEAKVSCDGD